MVHISPSKRNLFTDSDKRSVQIQLETVEYEEQNVP